MSSVLAQFKDPEVIEATVGEIGERRNELLAVAADSANATRELYAAWTFSEPNGSARELFATAANKSQQRYEQFNHKLGPNYSPREGGSVYDHMKEQSETVDRVASSVVAHSLVTSRAHRTMAELSERHGKPRIELFDDLSTEIAARGSEGDKILDEILDDSESQEHAIAVAERTIEIAGSDLASLEK